MILYLLFSNWRTPSASCVGFLLKMSLWCSLGAVATGAEPQTAIDFDRDVRPILSDKCFQCHGPDEAVREADLRFDTHEGALADLGGYAAIVPGDVEASVLLERIHEEDLDLAMPPPAAKLSLTREEKATLTRWIEQGALWGKHWAFVPPVKPAEPNVGGSDWPQNEIDYFVLARLQSQNLRPSPAAEREILLRRVTLDLTGLPSTPAEAEQFLADESPQAYEHAVDRLLRSDAHAERLALDWMDLARYADSHGLHADGARTMWPWREWVIQKFRENMPYDKFVLWQLAGDLLPAATREQRLATAFHRNHPMTAEGGAIDEEYRLNYVFDRVETTGTAFMGLTLQCCRCHTHKFDPIQQKEYYQLAAFFNNVQELGMTGDDGDFGPLLSLPDEATELQLQDLDRQLAQAAEQLHTVEQTGKQVYTARKLAGQHQVQLPQATKSFPLDGVKLHKKDDEKREKAGLYIDENPQAIAQQMPKLVEGVRGQAVQIAGEYGFLEIEGIGMRDVADPFSAALWVRRESQDREDSPPHTQTFLANLGDKNGFWRGWELMADTQGRLTLRLIHGLPDLLIHVRAKSELPVQQWTHLGFSYDGSGKAAGVSLLVDGVSVETEIVADALTRTMLPVISGPGYPVDTNRKVRVGISYRIYTGDNGIFNGLMDDLQWYDEALTAAEVAKLYGSYDLAEGQATENSGEITETQRFEHWLRRDYQPWLAAQEQYRKVLAERVACLSDVLAVMVMREMPQQRPMYVLSRGDYTQPGEQVEVGTVAEVFPLPEELPKNRWGLAQWLFLPKNPLTARVTVNRYWQMLFGNGLVGTPHDFGTQGERPTHPELLDWLAVSFRESGWDVRWLLKRIVMSATYRQSSTLLDDSLGIGQANRLLARYPSRRLPAEVIRDSALAASGLLNRKVGGPSVKPYQPKGLWIEKNNFSQYLKTYQEDKGEKLYRRSLYTFVRRTSPPPAMTIFDAPTREVCSVKREITNTPLQALVMWNDPQFVEAARVLAQRVQQQAVGDPAEQVTRMFRLLTSRQPTQQESELLLKLYAENLQHFEADPTAATELLSVGQQPANPSLDPPKTAALALVGNTLMSYDAFYMQR